jgi:hypothetical protein
MLRSIDGAGLLLSLLLISSAPPPIRATGQPARSGPQSPARPTYTARQVRNISVFGARLSMRLEEARAALVRRGFTRQPFPVSPSTLTEVPVLEADYRHPSDNTGVGLFYSRLPNGERRIGRIMLWEQIPVRPRATFERFLTERYGRPTSRSLFQGHDAYVWSQQRIEWARLLPSMQCMMVCVAPGQAAMCRRGPISRQVFMSGGFNTNMPGKLYWTADLNDLELQQSDLMRRGSYPAARPICPQPVS